MADLLIRDIPEEVMAALSQKASAAGQDRMSWIRAQLVKLASEPIITERYAYRVYSESGSRGLIRRLSDHPNGVSATYQSFSEDEARAMDKAADLIRRNGPGDREKAVALLQDAFEEVMEVPA